jgi:hypothetical protein
VVNLSAIPEDDINAPAMMKKGTESKVKELRA